MAFIAARDFLASQPAALLSGNIVDPIQPDIDFAFGAQPEITRNKDVLEGSARRRKVGIVGAGDVFTKFILPALAQRGTDLYIADPARAAAAVKEAQQAGCPAHRVSGIKDMPDDLDYILILTPPASHKDLIKEAAAKGVPVVVEKPLTASRQDTQELEEFLQTANPSLYCIDWEVMHALPLLHALGINVPFADALNIRHGERFKEFDLKHIVEADARFVESGDSAAGDLKKVIEKRPWLADYRKGGGILYDMAVHPLNVLATIGLKSTGIQQVLLGAPTDQKGVYRRFGKEEGEEKTGEIYARAELTMGIEGGNQHIKTIIEAGKNAKHNDGRIELTDAHGNKLRWEMFPASKQGRRVPGSRLEMLAPDGAVIATSSLQADCYSLVMEDVCRFAESRRHAAMYFPEHRDMIYTIADMHDLARAQHIADGETLTQLKTEKDFRSVRRPLSRHSLEEGTGIKK